MTMRERIAAGKLFTDCCEGLPEDRINCKKRMLQFNSSMPDDVKTRMQALNELLGKESPIIRIRKPQCLLSSFFFVRTWIC